MSVTFTLKYIFAYLIILISQPYYLVSVYVPSCLKNVIFLLFVRIKVLKPFFDSPLLFLPTASLSVNPVSSSFKLWSKSDHFSAPPLLPHWASPPGLLQ